MSSSTEHDGPEPEQAEASWNWGDRAKALGLAVIALVVLIVGASVYSHFGSATDRSTGLKKDNNIICIELGGKAEAPRFLPAPPLATKGVRVEPARKPASTKRPGGCTSAAPAPGHPVVSGLKSSLRWDLVFIAGYGLFLIIGAYLARRMARTATGRAWAAFALFSAVVVVIADLVEDLFLYLALSGHATVLKVNTYDAASGASVIKWSLLVVAGLVAVIGILLTLARALTKPRARLRKDETTQSLPGRELRPRWAHGYGIKPCPHATARDTTGGHVWGIALSGGGIRAASLALGALQSEPIRDKIVPKAQYLVSVSGGGYTAGAFQQALTGQLPHDLRGPAPPTQPDPRPRAVDRATTAFRVGSAGEDHIRRHSSYLADNPVQMLVALGLLARHLLLTLTLLFGPAVVIGVATGLYYRRVPITPIVNSVPAALTVKAGPAFPQFRGTGLIGIAALVLLALVCWLVGQHQDRPPTDSRADKVRKGLRTAAILLTQAAVVVAAMVIAIPTIMWTSAWLLHHAQSKAAHIASPIVAVLVTYLASLSSLVWKHKDLVTGKKKAHGGGSKIPKAAPRGAVQVLLVIVAFVVLIAGWLLLFGASALIGREGLDRPSTVTVLALVGVLLILGYFVDETTLSLHPFYRRRLAGAFAVRSVQKAAGAPIEARAYAPEERTTLSTYGVLRDPHAFPHVIFAASATLGQRRTPPGNNRVSYTFCADWVGGPDVGQVATGALEAVAPARLRRDLTVQGAVALSGAAIAASLGGQGTAWYEALFAISGARLGAWMPNPQYVEANYQQAQSWTAPSLPRVRRLPYLLRELFGVHDPEAPLLQVTDGGFYDNLGLVELFRRGCTRILCIDASGDTPPPASTLAEALVLAYEELGVTTELADETWSTVTPGSGEPMKPTDPLADLSARLSKTGIITGTFDYPPGSPFAARGQGTLVVAKAYLWPGLPYEQLAYAQQTPTFPHDSTADQFFDGAQFAAYTALGRALGDAAWQELQELGKAT